MTVPAKSAPRDAARGRFFDLPSPPFSRIVVSWHPPGSLWSPLGSPWAFLVPNAINSSKAQADPMLQKPVPVILCGDSAVALLRKVAEKTLQKLLSISCWLPKHIIQLRSQHLMDETALMLFANSHFVLLCITVH